MGKYQPKVVIIGCGLGGITLALNFKKRLGFDNFTIYERAAEPVGTWRDNTYPGCACDVPSHEYCLSTELNPNWSKVYSPQSEIKAYWERIYRKHKVDKNTLFDHNFEGAYWDNERQLYVITFTRTSDPDKKEFTVEANVLISCIGGFSKPSDAPPSLPGLKSFKGEAFHSARWRHDINLHGKRVAVIGNGCSATQFVPELAKDKTIKLLNFSRTPSWFQPRPQRSYTSFEKWAFAHIPYVLRLYKWFMRTSLDLRFYVWLLRFSWARHIAEERSIRHITTTAPKKYHDFLIPTYPFGCKRVILDPGYLQCLNEPNVELITDGIDHLNEKGIVGKSGKEYEFDVLILGTGFSVEGGDLGLDVVGRNGKKVTKKWEEQGGPQAYLGTTLAGYPNMFMILGPNVATGHASVTYSTESQVNYIIKMVEPLIKYGVSSFELKQDAEDRYQTQLEAKLDRSVWAGNCSTYYKLPNGKIHVTYPGRLGKFQRLTKYPAWDDYMQRGGTRRMALIQLRGRILKLISAILVVVGVRVYGLKRLQGKILIFLLTTYSDIAGAING